LAKKQRNKEKLVWVALQFVRKINSKLNLNDKNIYTSTEYTVDQYLFEIYIYTDKLVKIEI
jgi:hypothetical protein